MDSPSFEYYYMFQAVGDSGQGFFNAIIFCLLNKRIRESYKISFMKCIRKQKRTHDKTLSPTFDTVTNTETVVGVESEAIIDNIGSHELAKPYSKKWHVSSASFKAASNCNS